MSHNVVNVKVNVFVYERIAPLVKVLSDFERLFTVDSCEGSNKEPGYVYFKYGSSPKDLAVFCTLLAEKLSTYIKGSNEYSLCVEWEYDFSTNIAKLMTSHQNIQELAKAIESIAIS